jgi:hypothetical protein
VIREERVLIMTVEQIHEPAQDGHDVIHLGGEVAAVVVPIAEYRTLRALARQASAEDLEAAEMAAGHEQYLEWEAAGRPGAVSHEEAMAELLGGGR